ncbi:SDR family NAD(P)-dependent oxidoreductase [Nocardia sp. NPDC060220]|uniref:SDR family NAD(P)-dependent oxidoreductase n=1 Tax=Nocardia sp. NPDC060220 TaxID=3347076 RepID=UPI00365E4C59
MSPDVLASGRVAVITGAGSGIGAALGRALAVRGMRVALADVNGDTVEKLAYELVRSGLEVIAVATDVSDLDEVAALAGAVHSRWGSTHLLVNNAGIETTGRLWEIPPTRWDATIGINLSGVYHGVRAFMPGMLASGEPAHIVNLASVGSLGTGPFQTPYIVTKHGVLALTECLWQEFAAERIGIGVSAVLPGPVSTSIFTSASSADRTGVGADHLDQMRTLLATYGMSSEEVADRIIRGVAAGDLWIHTHPEMSDASIRARTDALLTRRFPSAPNGLEGIADVTA